MMIVDGVFKHLDKSSQACCKELRAFHEIKYELVCFSLLAYMWYPGLPTYRTKNEIIIQQSSS
jgi:hypothetical protein